MNPDDDIQSQVSDYGILDLNACDPGLRNRVIGVIHTANAPKIALSPSEINDIATYITQLEDALLRYNWGSMESHEINEILKCSTGLDIEERGGELAAMAAADG
jgi:hypothetical protein